jgi:hypothetical protein
VSVHDIDIDVPPYLGPVTESIALGHYGSGIDIAETPQVVIPVVCQVLTKLR